MTTPRPRRQVGEPLDALSVENLGLRAEMPRDEILRLEAAAEAKRASRDAVDRIFKR